MNRQVTNRAVTGFVMGMMLTGIVVAMMALGVLLNMIPPVHFFQRLTLVWIDMNNGQMSVVIRGPILIPAAAFALVSVLAALRSHRRGHARS